MSQRLLDLVLGLFLLVVLSPLLLLAAVLVKLEDGGPVFYRGERIGRGGVPFGMLKFRSMVPDAERRGPSSTASDDPRITRTGARLRRWKLDELPQLFNVLKGEMSFVGPRPQVGWDVAKYSEAERRILSVRPGITDWASIRFADEGEILKGAADPERAYVELIRPEKIRLCLKYVDERSLLVDLRILLLTARRLLGGKVEVPS